MIKFLHELKLGLMIGLVLLAGCGGQKQDGNVLTVGIGGDFPPL